MVLTLGAPDPFCYQASQDDVSVFAEISAAPDAAKYPHAARWYSHIAAHKASHGKLPGSKKAASELVPSAKAEAPAASSSEAKEAKEDEDDIDLFASDDEVDEEAERIKQERLKEYAAKKSASGLLRPPISGSRSLYGIAEPAVTAKSQVILDVKPWDDETNMEELTANVKAIEMDGLLWGAHKLVPVGYGIKKLQITCVVEDEKVSIDDLSEKIAEDEDHVQSVDVAAFNKL
ncbi:elongation factor 1-beta-like protein [Hyaloraphidium curvatum]|nr:elongation factor 1-beta-like protein [Hyaloraphidium curvatum]